MVMPPFEKVLELSQYLGIFWALFKDKKMPSKEELEKVATSLRSIRKEIETQADEMFFALLVSQLTSEQQNRITSLIDPDQKDSLSAEEFTNFRGNLYLYNKLNKDSENRLLKLIGQVADHADNARAKAVLTKYKLLQPIPTDKQMAELKQAGKDAWEKIAKTSASATASLEATFVALNDQIVTSGINAKAKSWSAKQADRRKELWRKT